MTRYAAHALQLLLGVGWMLDGCGPPAGKAPASSVDAAARPAVEASLRPVSLPDLSRLAESVRRQVRERYSSLAPTIENPTATAIERGEAFGALGKLFLTAEYLDRAESALLNAHVLMPGDARWPYYLGQLYRKRGDLTNSVAYFERSVQMSPGAVAILIRLGDAYLDQGRPEPAESLFARALSLEPDSAAALSGVGRAALVRHEYARAVDHLERALAQDQRASSIHYPLAMAYRGLGELAKADAHLRLRGDVAPSLSDPLMEELDGMLESAMADQSRGIHALGRGEWQKAADYFRRGIELGPDTPSLRHRLGTALFLMGNARGAVEQFEAALRLSPEFAPAHCSLGAMHASARRYPDAINRFAAAVRYEPDHVEARLALADLFRGTGRAADALRHYELLLTIDPRIPEGRLGYAMTLVSLGRYPLARDALGEAVRLLPDRPDLAVALARVLAAAPDPRVRDGRRALRILEALPEQPEDAHVHETMAMALAELGQFEAAVAWQQRAIATAAGAGDRHRAERMLDNLKLYQTRSPCRTPWRSGELP